MRMRPWLLLAGCSWLPIAACSSTSEAAPRFAPMPMAESAPAGVDAIEVWPARTFEHAWLDASGTPNRVAFRFAYRTRIGEAALAAECVHANWLAAAESMARLCERVSRQANGAHVRQCEGDVQQQLTDALFPRSNGAPLATVSTIEWVGK